MDRVKEHYFETCDVFLNKKDRVLGVFLQGSQNYGLSLPTSDVDSRAILIPKFDDIVFNKKPISATHIRKNDEHIDFKDIRLIFDTFKSQNSNALEILFTEYAIVNDTYANEWAEILNHRNSIARYNPHKGAKTMRGQAIERYRALEKRTESNAEVFDKFGYNPKQLHHILRIEDYLRKYIDFEPYFECLRPSDPEFILAAKKGAFELDAARKIATQSLGNIVDMATEFCEKIEDKGDPCTDELFRGKS